MAATLKIDHLDQVLDEREILADVIISTTSTDATINNSTTNMDSRYSNFTVPTEEMLYSLTTNPNLDRDVDTLNLVG